MVLNRQTIDQIIDLLVPFCATEDDRQALVFLALTPDHPYYGQIDFSGAAQSFCNRLIRESDKYGADEIGVTILELVLTCLYQQVGREKQTAIDALIIKINPTKNAPRPRLQALPVTPPPAAKDEHPEIADLLNQIADAEMIQVWGEVIELGERILAKHPNHEAARIHIANAYYRRSQRYTYFNTPAEAIEDFTRAIEYNPDHPVYYFERGRLYWWNSVYTLAVEDFTRALERDPDNLQYLYWRGMSYQKRGNEDAALFDFRNAQRSLSA